jgi:hypothetical protein
MRTSAWVHCAGPTIDTGLDASFERHMSAWKKIYFVTAAVAAVFLVVSLF